MAKEKETVPKPYNWCDRHNGIRVDVPYSYSYDKAYKAMSDLQTTFGVVRLCSQCDWEAINMAMITGMELDQPILKLPNGLALIAEDGGEEPTVSLVASDGKVYLTKSDIQQLEAALQLAKIWLKHGICNGIAI